MRNKPNSKSRAATIDDIINEIKNKSTDGNYIFRGEPECHELVSSNLYRELEAIGRSTVDIAEIQAEIVDAAKAFTVSSDDFDILTEIQHYGGKTNLIDFTTDYNIALFFACYGSPDKCGRVIIFKETEEVKQMLSYPSGLVERAVSQRSVFVQPPTGFVEEKYDVVCIPTDLKLRILQHLSDDHHEEITPGTIYNDIHGFIKDQNVYWMAYREFYKGNTLQRKVDEAKTNEEKQGIHKKSIEHYTNALERDLQLPTVYHNRGIVYAQKGEPDLAITDFTKAIELNPNVPEFYCVRGITYSIKGKFDEAITDCNMAIKLNPNEAESYRNRAEAYLEKGEIDEAISDCNMAIKLKPDKAESYNNRGKAYLKMGEIDEAISDYDTAIKLNPNEAESYNNRAEAYLEKDEFDGAISDYNTAIEIDPNEAESYRNRAEAYLEKGEIDEAISDYDTAIKLKPDEALYYVQRADIYREKGGFDEAIADYTIAIKLEPDQVFFYNCRALVYSNNCQFDEAFGDLDKAIKLNPDYARSYDMLKSVQLAKSTYGDDFDDVNKRIELDPDDALAYYTRGILWLFLGAWDKAKADLTVAKDKDENRIARLPLFNITIAKLKQQNVKVPEDIATIFS